MARCKRSPARKTRRARPYTTGLAREENRALQPCDGCSTIMAHLGRAQAATDAHEGNNKKPVAKGVGLVVGGRQPCLDDSQANCIPLRRSRGPSRKWRYPISSTASFSIPMARTVWRKLVWPGSSFASAHIWWQYRSQQTHHRVDVGPKPIGG